MADLSEHLSGPFPTGQNPSETVASGWVLTVDWYLTCFGVGQPTTQERGSPVVDGYLIGAWLAAYVSDQELKRLPGATRDPSEGRKARGQGLGQLCASIAQKGSQAVLELDGWGAGA